MPLCLVLHDLGPLPAAAAQRFFGAIFEIAPEHWPITPGATLVETGVSPAYLRDHLLRALQGTEEEMPEVMLAVTRVSPDAAWHNLPIAGEAWLREVLAD